MQKQKSIYRFAPGTEHKRTAIALQDGRFLEVKPIRQMFANGDAWSTSFMGEGALLSDGVNKGKITVDTPVAPMAKKETFLPPLNTEREIARKKSMLANLTAKHAEVQTEIHATIKKLAGLNHTSHQLDIFRKGTERSLSKLQQQQNGNKVV
jgi:hypothetical protein